MIKLLREPLLHFLLLGAALFVVFGLIGKWTTGDASAKITITSAKIDELIKGFKLDFKRSPTQADVQKLIDDYIREEVLCREAWAQGMDRDDRVIRARLRQRMEFFNDSNAADPPTPSDQELTAFMEKNPDRFRQPDGSPMRLSDSREAIMSIWMAARHKETSDAAYAKLLSRYTVVVEQHKTAEAAPAPTTSVGNKTADVR